MMKAILKKAIEIRRLCLNAIEKLRNLYTIKRLHFTPGIILGERVYIGPKCSMSPSCNGIRIGNDVTIVGGTTIDGSVRIGSNVIIAHGALILTRNHVFNLADALPYGAGYNVKPVTVEDNVWIGARVMIAPGVHVEEGAVLAMGSVVTESVPRCAVVSGNPAKIVRFRDEMRYGRLIREGKYLNHIRRRAPHHNRDVRINRPIFQRLIDSRGFMISNEILTVDPKWRSAILYQLSRELSEILFGNAGRFHIAIQNQILDGAESFNMISNALLAMGVENLSLEELRTDFDYLRNNKNEPFQIL